MGLLTLIGISIMAEHVGKSVVKTGKNADMERAQMEANSRERCARMTAEAEVEKARIRATAGVINTAIRHGYPVNGIMNGNNGAPFLGNPGYGYSNNGIVTSVPPSYSGSYTTSGGHIRDIDYIQNPNYGQYGGQNPGYYGNNPAPVYAIEGTAPAKKFCPSCGCVRGASQSFCENCGQRFV